METWRTTQCCSGNVTAATASVWEYSQGTTTMLMAGLMDGMWMDITQSLLMLDNWFFSKGYLSWPHSKFWINMLYIFIAYLLDKSCIFSDQCTLSDTGTSWSTFLTATASGGSPCSTWHSALTQSHEGTCANLHNTSTHLLAVMHSWSSNTESSNFDKLWNEYAKSAECPNWCAIWDTVSHYIPSFHNQGVLY